MKKKITDLWNLCVTNFVAEMRQKCARMRDKKITKAREKQAVGKCDKTQSVTQVWSGVRDLWRD